MLDRSADWKRLDVGWWAEWGPIRATRKAGRAASATRGDARSAYCRSRPGPAPLPHSLNLTLSDAAESRLSALRLIPCPFAHAREAEESGCAE